MRRLLFALFIILVASLLIFFAVRWLGGPPLTLGLQHVVPSCEDKSFEAIINVTLHRTSAETVTVQASNVDHIASITASPASFRLNGGHARNVVVTGELDNLCSWGIGELSASIQGFSDSLTFDIPTQAIEAFDSPDPTTGTPYSFEIDLFCCQGANGPYTLVHGGGENTVRDSAAPEDWTCPGPLPGDTIAVAGRLIDPSLSGRMDHLINGPGGRQCRVTTAMNPASGEGQPPAEQQ